MKKKTVLNLHNLCNEMYRFCNLDWNCAALKILKKSIFLIIFWAWMILQMKKILITETDFLGHFKTSSIFQIMSIVQRISF